MLGPIICLLDAWWEHKYLPVFPNIKNTMNLDLILTQFVEVQSQTFKEPSPLQSSTNRPPFATSIYLKFEFVAEVSYTIHDWVSTFL